MSRHRASLLGNLPPEQKNNAIAIACVIAEAIAIALAVAIAVAVARAVLFAELALRAYICSYNCVISTTFATLKCLTQTSTHLLMLLAMLAYICRACKGEGVGMPRPGLFVTTWPIMYSLVMSLRTKLYSIMGNTCVGELCHPQWGGAYIPQTRNQCIEKS